ncbi:MULTISPECIES: DUF1523 family protein [Nioella]|jgi:hypothetical protein|uniref:DUF1523 family protein n=1 Tax=Nioella TaxID=1775424 RepID=UPI0008FD02D7|nr:MULTISPECIES: DUF1523 family protein [Nioella]TBX28713.1 hypothetical protein TK43_03830 [Roseovarius sp. JS7-11]
MRWVRWIVLLLIALFIGGFLHYTLPGRDIVRITGTEIIRADLSGWNRMFYARSDTGNTDGTNRDLRLINTTQPDGDVSVYRNEDTGFGWPPYFKLDSSNLHAEAADLTSTSANPQWVMITHYGWRMPALSIYPNAVAIRAVDGPDASVFPWLNIVILVLLAAFLFFLWRLWERFEDRVIDPTVDWVLVRWAKLKDRVSGR